jgi:hypothetical protein
MELLSALEGDVEEAMIIRLIENSSDDELYP